MVRACFIVIYGLRIRPVTIVWAVSVLLFGQLSLWLDRNGIYGHRYGADEEVALLLGVVLSIAHALNGHNAPD